jgi:carboxyl-terminal processing protease
MRHFAVSTVIAVLAFAMAFFSGYLFGRAGEAAQPGPLAAVLEPIERLVPTVGRANAQTVLNGEEQERFRVFWEAWGVVEREYYNRDAIDRQKLIYGATKGMVDAVGDPYTVYLTPANREVNDTDLRGSFDGVGIQVDMRDGKLTVIAPLDDSPAAQAGVRPGDVVTHVDGKSISGKTLNDTVLLIRGQRGTTVSLTIVRPGAADPLVFDLTRAEIKLQSVRSRMLPEGVGYVRLATFASNTPRDTTAALKELLAQQPHGIVLDLRSNPGGYLHSSVEVASQFIADGVVLHQANGNGERQVYRAEPGGVATDARLAVLVNKGTASASEILAGALRDNGRAILIGEPTFGKGTVQNVHELSDRSGLRVTTAQWLTPNEHPLQGVGLTPDLAVAGPPESTAENDPQLEAAVRYLVGG